MPAIFMFTLVYWVVAIAIGVLIAWKITGMKWFLLWMVCALVLYTVIVWLFPPGYAKNPDGMELKVPGPEDSTWLKDTSKYNYDTIRKFSLQAGFSTQNGDTVPGWGPHPDRGIDPAPIVWDTAIWTFLPYYSRPRPDTVDWKKWFREYAPIDTTGLFKDMDMEKSFLLVIAGIDSGMHYVEPLTIDWHGKMNIKDSLLAIQIMIKSMLITGKYYKERQMECDAAMNEKIRRGEL
jgi:hypothetical protein